MPTKLNIFPCDEGGAVKGGPYSAQINPETISHSRDIQISEENGADTAGSVNQHTSVTNETLNFDLVFDGSGVTGSGSSVDGEIAKLLAVVYDYQGDIHMPNILLVSYGSVKFLCRLTSMKTDYTLFRPNGDPLRAKVSLSFKQWQDDESREKSAQKSSPDMTHIKTVREGDSLPLMCREIYGKMDYYLQVAEINGLSNFRELEVGSQLVFPPLDK